MKRRFIQWSVVVAAITFALLPVLIVLLMGGCKSAPLRQYSDTQDTYIAAVTVLLQARDSGEISEGDWQTKVLPLINAGDKILDDMRVAADAGTIDLSFYSGELRHVLVALGPWLNRKQSMGNTDGSRDYCSRVSGVGFGDPLGREAWRTAVCRSAGPARGTSQGAGEAGQRAEVVAERRLSLYIPAFTLHRIESHLMRRAA